MVYAMFIYLFFTIAELFKEFYSNTEHIVYWKYLLLGVEKEQGNCHLQLGFYFDGNNCIYTFFNPKNPKKLYYIKHRSSFNLL